MGTISDSSHTWQLYSVVPLGDQAASSMPQYPTHLHYPDTEPTNLFPIVIMLSNDQCLSHWFDSTRFDSNPKNYQNGRQTLNSFWSSHSGEISIT